MRRKENKDLLGIIVSEGIYERKYRLVDAAYGKILKVNNGFECIQILVIWLFLQILQEARSILLSNKYDPMVDKFPTKDRQLIDAITVTLENTCLFGEIILHMPDMSYRILALREQTDNDSQSFNWRELINWCIKYARYFNDRIIDSKGQELLSLLEQEINPDKRSADYINPYRDRSNTELDKNLNKKKHSKRLKRGPQLSRREDLWSNHRLIHLLSVVRHWNLNKIKWTILNVVPSFTI